MIILGIGESGRGKHHSAVDQRLLAVCQHHSLALSIVIIFIVIVMAWMVWMILIMLTLVLMVMFTSRRM